MPKPRFRTSGWILLGVVAFVAIAVMLESRFSVPFDMTYRIACAVACVTFIGKLAADYPGERWPWIALSIALLVNIGLFFTPMVDRPASRGELMIFALPNAVVVLIARIASYCVADERQRAMRQLMILALVVVILFGAVLVAATIAAPHREASFRHGS